MKAENHAFALEKKPFFWYNDEILESKNEVLLSCSKSPSLGSFSLCRGRTDGCSLIGFF